MTDLFERYDAYRAACEAALARVARGLEARAPLHELDGEFEDITSGDALAELRRERETAGSAASGLGLARLVHWIEGAVIESRGRALELQLREAPRSGASASRIAALREERLAELGAARAKLGHPLGLDRVRARLPGLELDAWRRGVQELLRETESAHRDRRAAELRRTGRDPADASPEAHRGLLRLERFDAVFPAERQRSLLELACGPLAGALGASAWYAAPRGRTRVWPIRVPREVAVVGPARDGAPGCAELFAAAGAALALTQTSAELPVELRRPWDAALGHAFAGLLRRRLADPLWLEELASGPHADDLAAALPAAELHRLRTLAGRFEFEWALAALAPESDPRRLSALYAQGLLEATGFEHPPQHYLAGAQSELPVLDALRGECLAEQLHAWLRARFGRRPWRAARGGELLRELWHEGSRHTAEEIAAALDLGRLDAGVLARSWV